MLQHFSIVRRGLDAPAAFHLPADAQIIGPSRARVDLLLLKAAENYVPPSSFLFLKGALSPTTTS